MNKLEVLPVILLLGFAVVLLRTIPYLGDSEFDKELEYYRENGFVLEVKNYEEFNMTVREKYAVLEDNVSRMELREFAAEGLWGMGHKAVYYNRNTKTIFIGRLTTVAEMGNLRIAGKFLVYSWSSG